jgi:epoxyqueuosine reductase
VNGVEIRRIIEELARGEGFELCGFAPAEAVERADRYREWLAAGRAGSMAYLHRHVSERLDARELLPGARTVIVCGLNYHQPAPAPPTDAESHGRVAMYAWGDDYHRVMKRKLFAVVDALRAGTDEAFDAKVCVDTAPLLERENAMRAGIGWIGKNTLVLNQHIGSYFFLGEIVTTLDLPTDGPAMDHCGSCTRCLEACPTQAFPAPYQMDATRCISYLTIEERAPDVPAELKPLMDDWVFGCDVCQQVCPYNREAPPTQEPRFAVREPGPAPKLSDLLGWTDDEYRRVLSGSAIKRAKPDMLRRNARIAARSARRSGE